MNEAKAFGIRIHLLRRPEFLSIIENNLKIELKTIQNGVNAASITELFKDEKLKNAILNSDLINVDGISVVWALRILGFKVPERVACPDIVTDLLSLAEVQHYSIFLLGTKATNLSLTVRNIEKTYPNLTITGYRDGYFQEEEEPSVIKLINDLKPDILLLGLPSPKKELFAEKYRHILSVTYIFGIGGLFDIISGKKKRAPKWVQTIGMEWFYRFLQEPKRMWRRYLIGNLEFIWLVIKERIKRV